MRLWSIHPKYLDAKGIVALWREGLLAKKVLEGKTKGYKNHPQLDRFKLTKKPKLLINAYLYSVYLEAVRRGYKFDNKKIKNNKTVREIPITKGQAEFELKHLLKKLHLRDKKRYNDLKKLSSKQIELIPLFYKIPGNIESWEKR